MKFWVKPNAGWPEQVGGRIMYPADPEYFGDYALSFRAAGASIVGGCCGTTPAHIASMRKALDSAPVLDRWKSNPSDMVGARWMWLMMITTIPTGTKTGRREVRRSPSKWTRRAAFRPINLSLPPPVFRKPAWM